MSEDIKKGLLGIVVDETTISQVMPDINSLTYRGYAVQELCNKCIFEEVAYLVLNGELPNKTQLNKFKKQLEKNRNITKNLREIIKRMPKKSHPMDITRTVVSVMGLEDRETNNNSPEANMRKAIRILAKTPTAIAAFFRARKGKNLIPPKKKLSFSENFFYMCFGKVPKKEIVKAFDVSLILYAEHGFNASTFTARTITSSLSDIHGAITGAIASLKGSLHGGANEKVMHMLKKIKKPENAKKWILDALENKKLNLKNKSYQEEINFLISNEKRNKYIKNLATNLHGNTLCLFQYVEKHGKLLYQLIKEKAGDRPIFYIHGGVEANEREQVRAITEKSDNAIIVASYGTFSTGINIRNLHNIVFSSPSKSRIRNLQSIGRGLRLKDNKSHATLYDIADDLSYGEKENYTLQHFRERINIYNDEDFDYEIHNIELGNGRHTS